MNSPLAALLVVTALFAAAWRGDAPAHHPDRQVAMQAFIEPEVLAKARESKRKAENIADSARIQRETASEQTADARANAATIEELGSTKQEVEAVVNDAFANYRKAVGTVNATFAATCRAPVQRFVESFRSPERLVASAH